MIGFRCVARTGSHDGPVDIPAGLGATASANFTCPTPYLVYGTDRLHPSPMVTDPLGVVHTVTGTAKAFTVSFQRSGPQPLDPAPSVTVQWYCVLDTHMNP